MLSCMQNMQNKHNVQNSSLDVISPVTGHYVPVIRWCTQSYPPHHDRKRQAFAELIIFWPSCAPGKGFCGGEKNFGSALLQPVRSVCVCECFFHLWPTTVTMKGLFRSTSVCRLMTLPFSDTNWDKLYGLEFDKYEIGKEWRVMRHHSQRGL